MQSLRGRTSPPPQTSISFRFDQAEYEFDGDRGEKVKGVGFHLHGEHGLGIHHDDPWLADVGLCIVKVAGTSYRLGVIQGDDCAAGQPLALKPEPANKFDRDAVAIYDSRGRTQFGYVPADRSAEIAKRLSQGENLRAFVLWEWRGQNLKRSGLTVLIYPLGALSACEGVPPDL